MPLYEYICERHKIFESVQPISKSDQPVACPKCGEESDRIMPTTFASMSRRQGLRERVPYHHHDVRGAQPKKAIARIKPATAAKRTSGGAKQTKKD